MLIHHAAPLRCAEKERRMISSRTMMQESGLKAGVLGAHYTLAASPARYAVGRGDWNGASELPVRPSSFPFAMAISHFARALGAARSGKPDVAVPNISKLAELRESGREPRLRFRSARHLPRARGASARRIASGR